MDHLCDALALPYLESHAITPVEFGAQDPAATQFFETYRPKDAPCIKEEF